MMKVEASASAMLVRPLAALQAQAGPRELARFFAATELTPELLAGQDARITSAQLCQSWLEVIRASGNPQIALTIAASLAPGSFGVVEYLCRAAPTVGAALKQWTRYLNLLNAAVTVELVEREHDAVVRVATDSEPPAPAAHELCFAVLVAQARSMTTQPWKPLLVEFQHAHATRPTVDELAYARWFGAPVRFAANATQVSFAKTTLALPLVSADPHLLQVLTRHADDLHSRVQTAPPFASQVRRVLLDVLRDDDAHLTLVATRLGVTERAIQRRLKEEGLSFQELREDVRRELATRYLDDERLSISEISFLLGYSEPSAFFRAFKRWTGKTPIELRTARRAS